MTRLPGAIRGVMLAAALSLHMTGMALAEDAATTDSNWYFIGDSDSPLARLDERLRDPFLTSEIADAGAPRYEFVLTLSDDSDPDRLRFTSGQSYGISGRSEMYTFLLNRSFDFVNDSPITPHFMAGLGMTYIDDLGVANLAQRSGRGNAAWKPAMQFGVGASYDISSSWALTAQYRAFFVGTDAFVTDDQRDGLFSQDFMIGARLRF